MRGDMAAAIEKKQPDVLDMLVTPEWPRSVLEVLMRSKCPKGISPDAFYLFMKQCQVSGMNPLIDQAHCVERRTNIGSKDKPDYVTQHVFQPTIAGMRARALRMPDFLGIDSAPVFADDKFEVDRDTARVTHVSKPFGRKTLVGAWARVLLKGRQPILVTLEMGTRPQIGPVWAQDPQGQLTKCAEALALRKAYPDAFTGHTSEEMAEANEAARVAQAMSTPAVVEVVAPPKPAGPVVGFGSRRGVPFDVLTVDDVHAIRAEAAAKIEEAAGKSPKWMPQLRVNLEALEAHWAARAPALVADTTATQRLGVVDEEQRAYAEREPTDAEIESERAARGTT